jgi:CubicO group peptidase (beta-lactamase class C family)
MISTAKDYAVFCQMFLNGGVYNGNRILNEETVNIMTSPHARSVYNQEERENMDSFYGYGWRVYKDGSYAHSGSDGTAAMVNPNLNLIVLVFTQSPGEYPGGRFYDLVKASVNE